LSLNQKLFNTMSGAAWLTLSLAVMPVQVAGATAWVGTNTGTFLPLAQSAEPTVGRLSTQATVMDMLPGETKHIMVSLNLRNQDQLHVFLQALHTPGNPSYHQFLTPAQFNARYAPTQDQVAAVSNYLTRSGFQHVSVTPNRTLISADGTAATVRQAFNTTLKKFTHQGRDVFANDRPAQVPAELGAIVGSVLGLQSLAVHHTMHTGLHTVQAMAQKSHAGVETSHTPVQYPGIYNAVATPAASNAIVGTISEGDMSYTLDDFATFLNANPSLPQITPTVVYVGTQTSDESGEVEWALDSQVIYGSSGGVQQLIFYTASSMEDAPLTAAYNAAVTDNLVSVVNVSLGECEADAVTSGSQGADDAVFQQAVAQGITFSVSTGDAGPYNCQTDRYGNPGVANTNKKKATYDVSEPASSPWVVAVGGTALFTTSAGAYNAQAVWNEGLSSTGSGSTRIWSSGGGFSQREAAPSWQTAAIVGAGHPTRGLPDVVFDAASASGTYVYITPSNNGGSSDGVIGGTSMAAPMFAGFWARLQSAGGNNLGFASPILYSSIPSNSSLAFPVTNATVNGDAVYYTGWSSIYQGMTAKASGWSAATGFGSLNVDNMNDYINANLFAFPRK